ncbi:MAG: ornithine cyclodeaminase family protein [Firmicutes bacterium]|nr:ornithine cyclodeaminase family protein [Bacillota bacterium]
MDLNSEREIILDSLQIGSELLYLTKKEVSAAGLSISDILELTRNALIAHGTKNYEMPAKIGVHPFREVFFHAMPAYVPSKNAVGLKWIECYPSNPEKYKLPQTTGLLIINDVLTGCPTALMDATWITAMRTPAVTSLAAGVLHPNATTFGMFGCGVQGVEHCRFIVHTLPKLKKIFVYDVNPLATDRLIKTVQPQIEVEIVHSDSPEEVAKSCEVLSSATVILLEPLAVVKDKWLSAGQTLLPCDLNTFFDPATLRKADKYFVDSSEEHELFASMGYFPEGLPAISGETGEILAGTIPGREDDDELIICSNIGMAVCDVVVGKEVLMQALRKGLGRKLPL